MIKFSFFMLTMNRDHTTEVKMKKKRQLCTSYMIEFSISRFNIELQWADDTFIFSISFPILI